MILSVALSSGTNLANVRYEWLANGVVGTEQNVGISLPDPAYSNFRFDVTPPSGAEELIAYDITNLNNWNVAEYLLTTLTPTPVVPLSPQLAQLRFITAAYLRVDPAVFIVNGADLFVVAANNARRSAELFHDFEYSRVIATLDLTAAGADMGDAVVIDGVATKALKSIVGVSRAGQNGFFVPLDFTRVDIAMERDRSELELCDSFGDRYPGDMGLYYYGTNTTIVQRGRRLRLYPGFTTLDPTTVVLYIEGYGMLRDYGTFDPGTDPEDFIVEFGFEYLQWAIICELNAMLATFVPRQEGNLAPPTAEREAAWKKLIIWDSYLVDGALTRSA